MQATQAMQEHIRQVFQDEEYVKKLFAMETPGEVQAALVEREISLTVDEIIQVRDFLMKKMRAGEELSEADLESVTGGVATAVVVGLILGTFVLSMIPGFAIGLTAGGIATNDATGGKW